MSHSLLPSILFGLLPCVIPPYALRLLRLFGMRRVGWVLFGVFSLLAMLQSVRFWRPMGLGIAPGLTLDLLNFLIPVLLLIGMMHIETLFKERLHVEQEEKRLRGELEMQVQARTAELNKTNEELQREISLRKQGEQELRKAKEQYRFLFDENPQPMWIFDLCTLSFLAFNRAALRNYGYGSSEFRDLRVKDLFHDEAEAFEADCVRPSADLKPRGPWRHVRKDGTVMDMELVAQDLVYGGAPARLILANDVTAQRLLQKQLLESQRAEVTARVAGGVADNFNKLITLIERDANTLVRKWPNGSAAEPLKRIAATAGSATGLTRQLLALVRRHPIRPQTLDLNEFIDRQMPTLTRIVGSRIAIEKMTWDDLPSIQADPALLEQILRDLVLNARDAMPSGGTLTVSTTAVWVDENRLGNSEEGRPGAYVCLTVSDTGCGMTPEVQGRLFEPFFTTKAPGKATGLGLATVRGLAKQHSGWIEVTTEPGAGSGFTIFFPCAVAPVAAGR